MANLLHSSPFTRTGAIRLARVVGGLQRKMAPETRYDGLHHYIISAEKQIRCVFCRKKKKMREMLCGLSRGLLYRLPHKVDVIGHNFNVFSLY